MYYNAQVQTFDIEAMRRVVDALVAMPLQNVLSIKTTFEIAGRADNAAFMAELTKLGQQIGQPRGPISKRIFVRPEAATTTEA